MTLFKLFTCAAIFCSFHFVEAMSSEDCKNAISEMTQVTEQYQTLGDVFVQIYEEHANSYQIWTPILKETQKLNAEKQASQIEKMANFFDGVNKSLPGAVSSAKTARDDLAARSKAALVKLQNCLK